MYWEETHLIHFLIAATILRNSEYQCPALGLHCSARALPAALSAGSARGEHMAPLVAGPMGRVSTSRQKHRSGVASNCGLFRPNAIQW